MMWSIRSAPEFDGDFDFRIFDDPCEMRDLIFEKNKIQNKSRIRTTQQKYAPGIFLSEDQGSFSHLYVTQGLF